MPNRALVRQHESCRQLREEGVTSRSNVELFVSKEMYEELFLEVVCPERGCLVAEHNQITAGQLGVDFGWIALVGLGSFASEQFRVDESVVCFDEGLVNSA